MKSELIAKLVQTQLESASSLSFLGLGLMGQPMVGVLRQAGYRLRIWNRDISKALALQQAGVDVLKDLAGLAGPPQVLISMLADGAAVLEVAHQALPNLAAGSVWIDMSSTSQPQALQMQALCAAYQVGFVDAPVSGGVIAARQASLAIMVGADLTTFAQVQPILQSLGRVTRVGEVGCGQLAKLCNQLIVGASIGIVAEALLLAQRGGADPALVHQAIRGGFAESRVLEVHGQRMLQREFPAGAKVSTQLKDMRNILAAAERLNLHLPLSAQVTTLYQDLADYLPDADHAALLLELERRQSMLR